MEGERTANAVVQAVFMGGFRRVVSFFYPPSCVGCGRYAARPGALCPTCWQSVRFIERPYCEVMGTPFSHDLGSGILSAEAIAHPPVFNRLRAVASYDGVCGRMVHALKYQDRLELAPVMAEWMIRAAGDLIEAADIIIPVPLHPWRLLSRRFNQSAELARHIAKRANKPFNPVDFRRIRRTAHQVGLGQKAREDNVRGAFALTDKGRLEFAGKRIVLVDDVYTTGATVSAAARVLKRGGVADITVLTFAMVLADPI